MDDILIPAAVLSKLRHKHNVSRIEVLECFENRSGILLIDDREEHRRDPPTLWFIAETSTGRNLKIVFQAKHGKLHVNTAYEPNEIEMRIYVAKGK